MNEILQNKIDRINSIYYSCCTDIKKSEDSEYISSEFSVSVEKTGKEIKQNLLREYGLKENYKGQLLLQLSQLVEQIGELPTSFMTSYLVSDWRGKLDIPKVYEKSKIYDEQYQKLHNGDKMLKYNDIARQFLQSSVECKKLNTVINNIDEKRKFKLNTQLASKIGF